MAQSSKKLKKDKSHIIEHEMLDNFKQSHSEIATKTSELQSLAKQRCSACVKIDTLINDHSDTLIKHCRNIINRECRCFGTDNYATDSLRAQFFYKYIDGKMTWFCLTCHKYSKIGTRKTFQDFHIKGSTSKTKTYLHDSMKKHLRANQHAQAQEILKKDNTFAQEKFAKRSCCCIKKLVSLGTPTMEDEIGLSDIQNGIGPLNYSEKFFYKYIDGNMTYFCITCHKHSTESSQTGFQDWHTKGTSFLDTSDLYNEMKKHLFSSEHAIAEKQSKCFEKGKRHLQQANAKGKRQIAEKCTENLCISGQFFASHNLPQRFFPDLCHILDIVTKNLSDEINPSVHPIGNLHHNKMVIKQAQIACYEATREKMAHEDKAISPLTGLQPRYILSYDKGTVYKDNKRQAIVITKVGPEGLPKEYFVSTSIIKDVTAPGICDHITAESSKIITTQNIALVCTHHEPIYAGCISDVGKCMKEDENYSTKIILLEDICHNIEKLMFPPSPDPRENWVIEAIGKCKSLISYMQGRSVSEYLKSFELNQVKGEVKFYVNQVDSKTRFIDYGHAFLSSILKNIEIFHKALPVVLQDNSPFNSLTKDCVRVILQLIGDPVLIARIFLLDSVFVVLSQIVKDTQSEYFGPFDFVRIRNTLINSLEKLKENNTNNATVMDIVDCAIFDYTYHENGEKHNVHINLASHSDLLKPCKTILNSTDCWISYKEWLEILLNRFDVFLIVPDIIRIGVETFTIPDHDLSDGELTDRVENFRHFYSLINTEFEPCLKLECDYLRCDCVYWQCKTFFSHVINIKETFISLKGLDHTKLFSFYLSHKNVAEISELQIKNIARALEVLQLLKCSQSGTEKVVSQVIKRVKRFESQRYDEPQKYDMVNILVFLSMNSSMKEMDASLARKKFLMLGHKDALKIKKPTHESSLTIKRMNKSKGESSERKVKNKKRMTKIKAKSSGRKVKLKKNPVKTNMTSSEEKTQNNPPNISNDTGTTFMDNGIKHKHQEREDMLDFEGFEANTNMMNSNEKTDNGKVNDEPDISNKMIFFKSNDEIKQENPENDEETGDKFDFVNTSSMSSEVNFKPNDRNKVQYCKDDCIMPDPSKNWWWVGCKYTKCCSLQKRLIESGFEGGNWFHSSCVGLEEKNRYQVWMCQLCSHSRKGSEQ